MSLRATIYQAFHDPSTRPYRIVEGTVWALIFISILILVVEAFASPKGILATVFRAADLVLLGAFALEYVLRVATHRPPVLDVFRPGRFITAGTHIGARIRFALRPMLLIDLLAVLAFVPELRGLRALRLLRLLRTMRLFRYANPFAAIFRAFEENSLLFIFGFTVLVGETAIGGLSFFFVEKKFNPEVATLFDGLWWALVTITTVGFGDITPVTTLGRIIAGVLMVGGMFTLALFAGFVGSSLVSAVLSIREEQFRMGDYVNHVVVLGYDDTSEYLLDLFAIEHDTDKTRVVVFEDRERPHHLNPSFLWVQGDPTKQSELDKVRLTHAKAAVVVGLRHVTPQIADARTILTTFTIRSYLRQHQARIKDRQRPLYVVAEILDAENVVHARTAGADEVVETRRVGFSMLAHAVSFHGTADAMSRVLLSGSYNAYVGLIPGGLTEPVAYQQLLERLKLTRKRALVIGFARPGEPPTFNPPRTALVEPGMHLIYFAERPVLEAPG